MSFNLKELRQALEAKRAECRDFAAKFVKDPDSMTEDDEQKMAALEAELAEAQAAVEAAEAEVKKQADRAAALRKLGAGSGVERQHDRREDDPKRGFAHFGEFAKAVINASRKTGAVIDERLTIGAAPTTYANESSGADGGFLIAPGFSQDIHAHSLEQDAFLPMCDGGPISGHSMTFPRDETTPWGANGIRAYWEGEADQGAQTKPVFGNFTLRLHKLMALVPVTDELISDAGAINAFIPRKAGESVRWKTNDALVNGSGVGKPLGVFSSGAMVEQAKEANQTADTIVAGNVVKMFARNTNPARAVWLVHPDAWPQLPLMTIGDQPVFTPPSEGIKGAAGGFLLGRPVYMTDTCQTLGDDGDIMFIDWQAMAAITKAGGIETATSMHLWFDYDMMAFRVTFRVDAQPWLTSAVSPANGSTTRSPFVKLADRT